MIIFWIISITTLGTTIRATFSLEVTDQFCYEGHCFEQEKWSRGNRAELIPISYYVTFDDRCGGQWLPTGISKTGHGCECLCLHACKRTIAVFSQAWRMVPSSMLSSAQKCHLSVNFINFHLLSWAPGRAVIMSLSHAHNMVVLYNW